jgi:hypothetical protein
MYMYMHLDCRLLTFFYLAFHDLSYNTLVTAVNGTTRAKVSHLLASLPTSCVCTACPKLSTSLEQTINNL